MKKETTTAVETVIEEVADEKPAVTKTKKVASKVEAPIAREGIVNCSSLYVRSKATKDSEPIAIIKENTVVSIVGEEKDFYKVVVNDKDGYCMKTFIK